VNEESGTEPNSSGQPILPESETVPTFECLFRAARDKYDEGDMTAALNLACEGLKRDEFHPGLLEVTGLAAYHLGEMSAALEKLEAASAVSPLSASAQVALADLYANFGKPLSARAILDFLIEPERCPTPQLPDVARIYGRLRAYREALRVCRRLVRLRSWYHPAHYGIAFYLAKLGRPLTQRIRYLREAHSLAPTAITYRIALAGALASLSSFEEACELIGEVPASAITCPCCVRRFHEAAQVVGDVNLARRLGAVLQNQTGEESRGCAGE